LLAVAIVRSGAILRRDWTEFSIWLRHFLSEEWFSLNQSFSLGSFPLDEWDIDIISWRFADPVRFFWSRAMAGPEKKAQRPQKPGIYLT
jgi:hypothetical protein